jgi:hypothetical protein
MRDEHDDESSQDGESLIEPLLGDASPEEYAQALLKLGIAADLAEHITGWRPPGPPHLPWTP